MLASSIRGDPFARTRRHRTVSLLLHQECSTGHDAGPNRCFRVLLARAG